MSNYWIDETGNQVVGSIGGSAVADVHTAELLANAANSSNVANALIKRNANGDITVRNLTATEIKIPTAGAAPTLGTATLVGGSATVNTTQITTNSIIFLTRQSSGGVVGILGVGSKSVGTSFTISSSSILDTSIVGWHLIEST